MTARTLLVYAVCLPSRKRLRLAGIAGERLALVGAGGLAAVTGTLPRAPKASMAQLRRYDAVLGELSQELPALLPARFGTCMDSPEELAFVLQARHASLREALAEVRGRVQMTLRGVDAPRAEEARPEADAPPPASGVAYLRALARAAAREREVPALAPVLTAVARWVRAERVERQGTLASVYHLIPRSSVPAYVRAAERAAESGHVGVVLTGPFPAYAFAEW